MADPRLLPALVQAQAHLMSQAQQQMFAQQLFEVASVFRAAYSSFGIQSIM